MFTRIIGIGSPFGLDRIGIEVVEQLKTNQLAQRTELLTLDRPGLGLVDYFDVDSVLLVDAVLSDGLVGEASCVDIRALEKSGKNLSTHNAGIVDAIALARNLDVIPGNLKILGINIGKEAIGTEINGSKTIGTTDTGSEIPSEWIQGAKDKIIELAGKE